MLLLYRGQGRFGFFTGTSTHSSPTPFPQDRFFFRFMLRYNSTFFGSILFFFFLFLFSHGPGSSPAFDLPFFFRANLLC